MANTPRIITEARASLASLVSSAFFRHGRSKGWKAMRCDYAQKTVIVLDTMLKSCCLQFDGELCRVSRDTARPLTVPEIASLSGINQRTVERILHDLKDMGLISAQKQFKRFYPAVGLKVAAVWRMFTQLFWEKLGLWSLFVESVKYAVAHGRLKLKNPLKTVGKKKSLMYGMGKPPSREEERRRSQKNTRLFLDMTNCPHRNRAKTCPGGHMSAETCALCRRFPT